MMRKNVDYCCFHMHKRPILRLVMVTKWASKKRLASEMKKMFINVLVFKIIQVLIIHNILSSFSQLYCSITSKKSETDRQIFLPTYKHLYVILVIYLEKRNADLNCHQSLFVIISCLCNATSNVMNNVDNESYKCIELRSFP